MMFSLKPATNAAMYRTGSTDDVRLDRMKQWYLSVIADLEAEPLEAVGLQLDLRSRGCGLLIAKVSVALQIFRRKESRNTVVMH